MRFDDVNELLTAVQASMVRLRSAYEKSRNNEGIRTVLRPDVKSSLEHLRSCLEYCAQDTHAALYGGSRRLYFPYGKDERHFKDSVANNLPNLQKKSAPVYALFESIQPFRSGSEWLTQLCNYSNFNKHDSLTKQDRVNSPNNFTDLGSGAIGFDSNSTVVFHNATVNGIKLGADKPLVIDGGRSTQEIRDLLPSGIAVKREFDWVEFRFPGTALDALQLIQIAHTEVLKFSTELKGTLP